MFREPTGFWRVRSRAADFRVDFGLKEKDLEKAKVVAEGKLNQIAITGSSKGTLGQVATAYLTIPRKASDNTARRNVSRLKTLVRKTLGKTLDEVKVSALPDLWHRYVAKRQGRASPDYSRQAILHGDNNGINSAIKQAAAIFRRKLWPHYARLGIILPHDCVDFELVPAVKIRKAAVDEAALLEAWSVTKDLNLWLTVGLARFAGMRQGEILNARGKWFEKRGEGAIVKLQERREDRVLNKTGEEYIAPILNRELADYVLTIPAEGFVIQAHDRTRWIARKPQKWLKQFTGSARAPLHRLRGLYADQIKRETADAILARTAGIKAAQEALGHTTPETTERHYLSDE